MVEQVTETRLLAVQINDRMSWQSNTSFIMKKAYKRMTLLHKLYELCVPLEDLVDIYVLYIRPV